MNKHTYTSRYEARLGKTGRRTCIIPDQVADDQKKYDGKSFVAFILVAFVLRVDRNGAAEKKSSYRRIRVKLVGADYRLDTTGTGTCCVRPLSRPYGFPVFEL